MIARTSALLVVLTLVGCQWEGRPDGADANHSSSDGFYETDAQPQVTPLGGGLDDGAVIEPLDAGEFGAVREAPVPLPQPAPTGGAADNTSEVEEALTPGTER